MQQAAAVQPETSWHRTTEGQTFTINAQGTTGQQITMEGVVSATQNVASGVIKPYDPDYSIMCPQCYKDCRATEQLWDTVLQITMDREFTYMAFHIL